MVAQSAEFKKAVEDSRKLTSKPTQDELLNLYGLYKTGTGEDFSAAKKPGMFDLTGKAKYGAWEKVHSTAPAKAQTDYVALVESLKKSRGYDANKKPE